MSNVLLHKGSCSEEGRGTSIAHQKHTLFPIEISHRSYRPLHLHQLSPIS